MTKNFLTVLIIFVIMAFKASAQETEYGAFGALDLKSIVYKDQSGLLTGGKFGWVINKKFVIGASYYALVTSLDVKSTEIAGANFDNLNYGGLDLEYFVLNKKDFHASVSVMLGGGGISLSIPADNPSKKYIATLNLLVYEPGCCFEYSIFKWLSTSLGVSYRVVKNLSGTYGIYNNDFSGLAGSFSIRFGDYR